jgi:hypothetical protein
MPGGREYFPPGVDFGAAIFYHMACMKKMPFLAFPVLFALLTLGLYLLLYLPAAASPGMTSSCLVFFTALSWCALIVFGRREMNRLKTAYAAGALLASILVAGVLRPFPVLPLHHFLMIALQVLGGAGIVLYLHILKNKGE